VTTVARTGIWAAFVERRVIVAHIEPILIVTGAATALPVARDQMLAVPDTPQR
jgi:hypothetical protein